jgi:hypothetical protein
LRVKARSEFVSLPSPGVLGLVNFSDGGVAETNRRFHIAVPGSHQPALRPTRGSGLGAAVDIPVEDDRAHDAIASKLATSDRTIRGAFFIGGDLRKRG